MRSILTVLLVSLGFSSAMATRLKGVVSDREGLPVPYAAITVQNSGKTFYTNGSGQYSMELKPGQYLISFKSAGFNILKKRFWSKAACRS